MKDKQEPIGEYEFEIVDIAEMEAEKEAERIARNAKSDVVYTDEGGTLPFWTVYSTKKRGSWKKRGS